MIVTNILKKNKRKNFFGKIYKIDLFNGEFLPNYHPYRRLQNILCSKKKVRWWSLLTQIHELDLIISFWWQKKFILIAENK